METGKFYFIANEYYVKFENCGLLGNKDIGTEKHGRPCFYCFRTDTFCWMIPISSKVEKYEKLYKEKMKRYKGKFDGIRFGYVNGEKRAFLVQNLCPVTEQYVEKKYRINRDTVDVVIDPKLAKELNSIVKKVLRLYKQGIKIVMTDLDQILDGLK